MFVADWTFRFIQILLIGVIVGVLLGTFWWFNNQSEIHPGFTGEELHFYQYITTAGIYYGKVQSFGGVCEGLRLTPDVHCSDGEDFYVLSTRLDGGAYYCADSTGYHGAQLPPPQDQTCR